MKNNPTVNLIAKSLLWLGLGVIMFVPLFVDGHLFFPFITTKTYIFNTTIEVMLLAYLLLALNNPEYRLRLNLSGGLMALYLVLITIASLAGDYFYHSFWSNNERSEGILLLIHLFIFLLITTGFLRKMKDWLLALDIFLVAGLAQFFIGLDQLFKWGWFHFDASTRISGSLGNAGYMAGYMIFVAFFALFLLFKRQNIWARIYYFISILASSYIVFYSLTRGGMIGLALSIALFGLYLVYYFWPHQRVLFYIGSYNLTVRRFWLWFIGLTYGASIFFGVWVFVNKNSDFVKNSSLLTRITSISVSEGTGLNRMIVWKAAWQGFKERPILGWGYENFYQPFDKYFSPTMTEPWFDRSHNMFLDRLLTGGIFGLLSYLALLFVPLFFLWRHFIKNPQLSNRYFIPVWATLAMMAYCVQNMFIFEALVTYIPLFLMIALIGLFNPESKGEVLGRTQFKMITLVGFTLLFVPALYAVVLIPLDANKLVIKALGDQGANIEQRMQNLEDAISENTPGNQEYYRQYANLLDQIANSSNISQDFVAKTADRVEISLDKMIAENSNNVSNYLVWLRFNTTYGQFKPERFKESAEAAEHILSLSPGRPLMYYEVAYAYLYYGMYLNSIGSKDRVATYMNKAIETSLAAVKLDTKNAESHRQLAMIMAMTGQFDYALSEANEAINLDPELKSWSDKFIKQVNDAIIKSKASEVKK